jgi:predicted nucleic acid-binding protein
MLEQNLDDVPEGSNIFVDTNIFHFYLQNLSISCTRFIERIALGEIAAFVNIQVLSDLLHKLMMAEAQAKGCCIDSKGNNAGVRGLKHHLKVCRDQKQAFPLTDYQAQFENILSLNLHVLPINEKLLIDTKQERKRYYLMTGDSLHLGTMSRHVVNRRKVPLQNIATYDGDFAHIPGITLWKPMDIPW